MDFIETIFGVSPDGGSGATEALLVAVLIAAGCGLAFRRQLRRKLASVMGRTLAG